MKLSQYAALKSATVLSMQCRNVENAAAAFVCVWESGVDTQSFVADILMQLGRWRPSQPAASHFDGRLFVLGADPYRFVFAMVTRMVTLLVAQRVT